MNKLYPIEVNVELLLKLSMQADWQLKTAGYEPESITKSACEHHEHRRQAIKTACLNNVT